MAKQPTPSAAKGNPLAPPTPSNLRDRHEIGAQIAREILASSAPTPARGFRPLAASIFELAEQLGSIGSTGEARS